MRYPDLFGPLFIRLADGADRLATGMKVNGGAPVGAYMYDAFGRQTTIPASDAPKPPAGNLALGYFDDDLPRTGSQGDTPTVFTLDSQSRRVTQTSTDATSVTGTVVRHYTDGSDNPSWVEETTPGQPTVTTRFVEGLSSELGAQTQPLWERVDRVQNHLPLQAGPSIRGAQILVWTYSPRWVNLPWQSVGQKQTWWYA